MSNPVLAEAITVHNHKDEKALLSPTRSTLKILEGHGGRKAKHSKKKHERDSMFWWRIALVIETMVGVVLFAGPIYGFSQIELILKDEGVYKQADGTFNAVKYNTIITIASTLTAGSGIIIGTVLDHIGPRWLMLMATAFCITACLLFGLLDEYMAAFCLFALGGMSTLLSAFRTGFLFPDRLPLIVSGASCLFDSSSVVFAVFYQLYQHGVTVKQLFVGYAIIAGVLGVCNFVLWSIVGTEQGGQSSSSSSDYQSIEMSESDTAIDGTEKPGRMPALQLEQGSRSHA